MTLQVLCWVGRVVRLDKGGSSRRGKSEKDSPRAFHNHAGSLSLFFLSLSPSLSLPLSLPLSYDHYLRVEYGSWFLFHQTTRTWHKDKWVSEWLLVERVSRWILLVFMCWLESGLRAQGKMGRGERREHSNHVMKTLYYNEDISRWLPCLCLLRSLLQPVSCLRYPVHLSGYQNLLQPWVVKCLFVSGYALHQSYIAIWPNGQAGKQRMANGGQRDKARGNLWATDG